MSNLSQFFGNTRRTTAIYNADSSGGVNHDVATLGQKQYLSGALTANTYKEVLSVTGSGVLVGADVSTLNATSRTVGIKIVIDGTTVFDAASSSFAAGGKGLIAVGMGKNSATLTNSSNFVASDPIPFSVSLSVQIKSSLTETDNVQAGITYRTTL